MCHCHENAFNVFMWIYASLFSIPVKTAETLQRRVLCQSSPTDSHRRNVYPRKVNVNKLQECPLGEKCPQDEPSVSRGGRHNAKYTANLTTYLKYLRLNALLSKN